jgi:hypothetical protein
MSDYAYVADRARRAFSSVARIESALLRRPDDKGLQLNLISMRRLAESARNEMLRIAALNQIEVCNYKLSPIIEGNYALEHVAGSFLQYQFLFSQVHDAIKHGRKNKASLPKETAAESALNFAYSYSGSLGVVLLAKSERDFFDGSLDKPIAALYDIMDLDDADSVRDIAHTLGRAVVKRVHDWSLANVKGGFAADIRWKTSDGKERAQVIDRGRMERIVGYIDSASEEETLPASVRGMLVGVSLPSRTFHLVEPGGDSYSGHFHQDFDLDREITVGRMYAADLETKTKVFYATDKSTTSHTLKRLQPAA